MYRKSKMLKKNRTGVYNNYRYNNYNYGVYNNYNYNYGVYNNYH